MEHNIINNTLKKGERVSSAYAEAYFADKHSDYKEPSTSADLKEIVTKPNVNDDEAEGLWVSPSDLLIGVIDLIPPFTSKIHRGVTHEGILAIGNEIVQNERALFIKELSELIHENDAAWRHILQHETASVTKNVQEVYAEIFKRKSRIMNEEISKFYEKSLHDLENHLRSQVLKVKTSAHGSIVSKLNAEIKEKLEKEKKILEKVLQSRYETEVNKIKKYYKLLLNNELDRHRSWIHKAITERNDALRAFYRQIEAEHVTSTMYILCTERKKCRIKQFIMQNYLDLELKEKYQKIKQRQDIIDIFKEREIHTSQINQEWEDKIKKVLQLFLRFISFSMKLLPEQATFLLDFEKMVVLQLNEIKKMPEQPSPVLFDYEKFKNIFKFETKEEKQEECTKEPFVIVGNLSVTPPPKYGSRETLPDEVDLPSVRLQRQFVYAKCHKYEDIKAMLEAERCKCMDFAKLKPKPVEQLSEESIKEPVPVSIATSESSLEPVFLDDIQRLPDCPAHSCQDWLKKYSFPQLDEYLDFDEEKFERVKVILGKPPDKRSSPMFIDPKDIAHKVLPFSVTKEPRHTVSTQYSSQENLNEPDECTCIENFIAVKRKDSPYRVEQSPSKVLHEALEKRRISLRRLLQQNPDLLEMFTDESFDFQY